MMNPRDLIKKPCSENWHEMSGDDRRRFCEHCSCHVYNLTGMNMEQISALKKQNGGKLCGMFLMPAACDEGVEESPQDAGLPMVKPLALGIGVASFALAACQSDYSSFSANNHPAQTFAKPPHASPDQTEFVKPCPHQTKPPEIKPRPPQNNQTKPPLGPDRPEMIMGGIRESHAGA